MLPAMRLSPTSLSNRQKYCEHCSSCMGGRKINYGAVCLSSVERVEVPETPTSQNIIASTQARFKINDLLNIAPDTGKKKFRSQTTLRWGIVVEDPV